MHADLLDRAFLGRLPEPSPPRPRAAVPAVDLPSAGAVTAAHDSPAAVTVPATDEPSSQTDAGVVQLLIEMAADEWQAVADAVERAAGAADRPEGGGGFVLAIVSKRPGDGCTTFTRVLGEVLRGRGHDVVVTTPGETARRGAAEGGIPSGIALLDAGAWFGTGAIRRERAEALAGACDAAILLRRADRASAAAFARAIAVSGVKVLGEVATFSRGVFDDTEATES